MILRWFHLPLLLLLSLLFVTFHMHCISIVRSLFTATTTAAAAAATATATGQYYFEVELWTSISYSV